MQRIDVERQAVDLKKYTFRTAEEADCTRIIDKPTIVKENGEIKIVYAELDRRLPDLVQALRTINYERNWRTGGLPTNSRIFGYAPRSVIRKDFCSATSLAGQFPREHEIICARARVADRYYKKWNPDLHRVHLDTTSQNVKEEWHIDQSVFTSGIVNKNNPLRYHFDAGNFKNVWSAMMVFKSDVTGGGLNVPEYNLHFKLRDHSILMFDGQGLLHGVTPFQLLNPKGYRYSIVYYSLRQMWNCLPPEEELKRIRKLKTARELKRAGL